MHKIRIGGKFVGEGEPTFIIAEAGLNPNGDFGIAKRMVEVAAEAKADAVTFQHVLADRLFTNFRENPSAHEWDKWLFTEEQLVELFEYAASLGLLYTACVIDDESVDKMVEYDASFLKIISADLTDLPFLEHCAIKKLPILMSTGAAWLGEVEAAVNAIRAAGNQDILLYHTNSGYPTPPEGVNLRIMDTLRNTFMLPVGFCDHTLGVVAPIVAVARGASVIEKHFTLDRSLMGTDYEVSLEPEELKEMIASIRLAEEMLGSPKKKPLEYEQKIRTYDRRSIVSRVRIPEGTTITRDMLAFKRPGTGIAPSMIDQIVGRAAGIDMDEDEVISFDMIL